MDHIIGKKIHEVEIRNIFVDTIANKNIVEAIVVCIKKQSAPTPISCRYTTVICCFQKLSIPVIYHEAVLHELMVKTFFETLAIQINIVECAKGFKTVII